MTRTIEAIKNAAAEAVLYDGLVKATSAFNVISVSLDPEAAEVLSESEMATAIEETILAAQNERDNVIDELFEAPIEKELDIKDHRVREILERNRKYQNEVRSIEVKKTSESRRITIATWGDGDLLVNIAAGVFSRRNFSVSSFENETNGVLANLMAEKKKQIRQIRERVYLQP